MAPTRTSRDLLACYCSSTKCTTENNSTCFTDGVCYSSVTRPRAHLDEIIYRYGCLDEDQLFPRWNPIHCQQLDGVNKLTVAECCKDHPYCNRDLKPIFSTAPETDNVEQFNYTIVVVVTVSILLVTCLLIAGLIIWRRFKIFSSCSRWKEPTSSLSPTVECDLMGQFSDQYSGSGAGLPLLTQRTISMQIELRTVIGKGRYGEVWLGNWKGEDVAVKIFHSREEQSWFREAEIYQTIMLQHKNILAFVAADNKDNGSWTQLWLVTEYHPLGSLFDYLNTNTVDLFAMLKLVESIASGLSHLHTEIFGTSGKPAIAHRDLKSKNILVKADGCCCIADLGLAVKHKSSVNVVDIAPNTRVGTLRYMAPEALNDSLDTRCFDSFKYSDVYSLGLVYWEIVSQCTEVDAVQHDYQLPYYDLVPSDPTHEEMYQVVVIDKKRPEIPVCWKLNEKIESMSTLIEECWCESPTARLSVLRIRKTLNKLKIQWLDDNLKTMPL